MAIESAYMVPHPPMIVPAIGRGSEKQIEKTTESYRAVADEIAAIKPDTIIIVSPHTGVYLDYYHISPGSSGRGSFASFGAPEVKFDEEYDTELVRKISSIAEKRGIPAGTLGERLHEFDHGVMVPLYFIREKYKGGKIVRMCFSGRSFEDHYEYGKVIRDAVEKLGRRAVFVASGDLSHKLQSYGPYGYTPEGPEYDARIMDVCSRAAFSELLEFDEKFCDKAAECGHRAFIIMAGALDGSEIEAKQLSHEDVTGVGYGICTFHPIAKKRRSAEDGGIGGSAIDGSAAEDDDPDPYVTLARQSVEYYVRNRRRMTLPGNLPDEMYLTRAGAFVSIHKNGNLRGCIGTIGPTEDCVASEIISNAINAAERDPRFDPIAPDELESLEINVDVMGAPEDIDSLDQLNVKRYGVIVSKGGRRGLLLPDLEGVDTVEQQVYIAMRKAGISSADGIKLQRFEVIRHK